MGGNEKINKHSQSHETRFTWFYNVHEAVEVFIKKKVGEFWSIKNISHFLSLTHTRIASLTFSLCFMLSATPTNSYNTHTHTNKYSVET